MKAKSKALSKAKGEGKEKKFDYGVYGNSYGYKNNITKKQQDKSAKKYSDQNAGRTK